MHLFVFFMALVACAACAAGQPTHAQTVAPVVAPHSTAAVAQQTGTTALRQAFDAAWARRPEAVALPLRRDAAHAAWRAAQAWTPAPPSVEASVKTDRPGRSQGGRETDVGIAVPLWLPGERQNSTALAEAESRALDSHANAAQLRVAAALRDAWWAWQRAQADAAVAQDQLANARQVAADVARRVRAGDLARADQNQADTAVASAESTVALAAAAAATNGASLLALTGAALPGVAMAELGATVNSEPVPPDAPASTAGGTDVSIDHHGSLRALQDRIAIAQRSAALAASQARGNPELTLALGRERGSSAEAYQQTVMVGVRIPFGGGARHSARLANAAADTAELQAELALQRAQLLAQRDSARVGLLAARTQLAAAERRAVLASETRGFFDKSFGLGQTDLPTRLRTEADAVDAQRQAARARIELAAAVSTLRQALGLLPE